MCSLSHTQLVCGEGGAPARAPPATLRASSLVTRRVAHAEDDVAEPEADKERKGEPLEDKGPAELDADHVLRARESARGMRKNTS